MIFEASIKAYVFIELLYQKCRAVRSWGRWTRLEPGFETSLIYGIILGIAGSFNGRTEDFGSSNLGPIPSPAADSTRYARSRL